jgi:DNA-binding LacI/PurR family transcriptional regulator
LRIPDDIAVISVDNIEISQYTYPPLSTVDIPKKEMGEVAVQLLLGRINGDMSIPKHILLPTRLIVRESSGRIKT